MALFRCIQRLPGYVHGGAGRLSCARSLKLAAASMSTARPMSSTCAPSIITARLTYPTCAPPFIASRASSSVAPPVEDDYVKHWNAERVLSVALLATVPAAFITSWPALDYAATLSLVVHSHWGVMAIVNDYVRPKVFGALVPKVAVAITWFLSAFMLGGLFYFNYTDVGLVEAVKMTWRKV